MYPQEGVANGPSKTLDLENFSWISRISQSRFFLAIMCLSQSRFFNENVRVSIFRKVKSGLPVFDSFVYKFLLTTSCRH